MTGRFYQSRLVRVEAVRFTGDNEDAVDWLVRRGRGQCRSSGEDLVIYTHHDESFTVYRNYWLVLDEHGELLHYGDDAFNRRYEPSK